MISSSAHWLLLALDLGQHPSLLARAAAKEMTHIDIEFLDVTCASSRFVVGLDLSWPSISHDFHSNAVHSLLAISLSFLVGWLRWPHNDWLGFGCRCRLSLPLYRVACELRISLSALEVISRDAVSLCKSLLGVV